MPVPFSELQATLLAAYRSDPDPGIHGAIDWLLRRRWDMGEELDAINKELASPKLPTDRDWYVNGQGQTYSIVRGPVEFLMGSTTGSDGLVEHRPEENQHRRLIQQSCAIAAREVTVAEYVRFLEANVEEVTRWDEEGDDVLIDWRGDPDFRRVLGATDCAIGIVTMYEAMRYCNWLSREEGVPKEQWAYPDEPGEGMKLPVNSLARTGYRLPTEGEWEYACRAGTIASHAFGGTERRLADFGWYLENSGQVMHSVGLLKPNDLGLFDALGNAYEWCGDGYAYRGPYPTSGDGTPTVDALADTDYTDEFFRVMRGGSFIDVAANARSAGRARERPSSRVTTSGFRPSRTYP